MILPLALLAAVLAGVTPAVPEAQSAPADAGHASLPGRLEGRPAADEVSVLQARIDAAPPGATIEVGPGTYRGDLLIDRPLRLVAAHPGAVPGRALLIGSGHGSVVRIRAADVTLVGFDIDGQGGGDLGSDTSGIHISGARATVRDCRVLNSIFGIYLRQADGAAVVGCQVRGIPGRQPGEKGSGIHVWNTKGFRLERNAIVGNVARDLRYGLHYMYSDDNLFEDNTFENGAAGTAIMYSRRIVFRRNRFLRNRGFASVGLLLKACDAVLAEDNLIADNARGIFLEGSNDNVIRRNVVAASDMAIVLYDSCARNRVTGNSFVGNMTPLFLVGRRTDTLFEGNYWSDNDEPDLDGDGRSDRPYRLSSIFDHFRGNLIAADLFAQGPAASAIAAAERSFPVLQAIPVEDRAPLARPPILADVPAAGPNARRADPRGVAGSLLLCAAGAAVMLLGGRRRAVPAGVAR
jgi:nitrous oxidase accessory protein